MSRNKVANLRDVTQVNLSKIIHVILGQTLWHASPTIRNSTFAFNHEAAILAKPDSFPIVSNITFAQNGLNGLAIDGRDGLNSSQLTTYYWNNSDVVYIITGNLTVGNNVTLVIEPGVIVKFRDNMLIAVKGGLKVQGTIEEPVVFTTIKDDSIGGDTNSDGRNTLLDSCVLKR